MSGIVVDKNGNGISAADVIMRSESIVNKITVGLSKMSLATTATRFSGKQFDSTKTSLTGFFAFDSVDTGHYYIEINDHNVLGALARATITTAKPVCVVDTITLKHFGAIQGSVDSALVKSGNAYVQIVELGRSVAVGASGKFEINLVPPDTGYTIRLVIDSNVVASPLDTEKIAVKEGDTAYVGIRQGVWTNRSFVAPGQLRGVVWGSNQFVAVTCFMGDTFVTSADGVTWTIREPATPQNLAVTWGNNQFVAVGGPYPTGGSGVVQTSPDGITWTAQTSGTPDMICGVAWGNNTFVSVEWWPSTSSDGITWTAQSATSNHLDGITWGDSQFVAVGRGGIIYTSPDGVSWAGRTPVTSRNLVGITWGNNEFVAVGDTGTIILSSDGISWTNRTSGTSNMLRGVAYGNNQYIAVGYGGTILASADGISWTAQTAGTINDLNGVTYGNNQFVAVGANGTILTLP